MSSVAAKFRRKADEIHTSLVEAAGILFAARGLMGMALRVERAKRMLQQREPIAEIAVASGFSHQEHLTNVFRRFTGVTPGAYRRVAAA